MKKITAIILCAASLAVCAPTLSGCGGDGVKFTLSEDGSHYTVSFSGFSSSTGEYEIPAYYGEENIPVTEIADEGFASTRFSKITIPETVTKIGTAAFSYCSQLKSVEFAEGTRLEKISHGMLAMAVNLTEIVIPDSVKEIEGMAFYSCYRLTSVTMGNVEIIGSEAFEGCTALQQIALPSTLVTIGAMAFYSTGLKAVEIPDSVRDIQGGEDESTVYGLGYAAFNNCINLESVKIGSGVGVIPSAAFGYCIGLKEIYLPLSVKEVQGAYYENESFVFGHAFYYCTALTDVYYEGDEEQWKNIHIDTKNLYASGVTMDNTALIDARRHYGYK